MPKPKPQLLTLASFQGGGLEERFALELRRVLQNIADPNTAPDQGRSITIKFDFKPSEDRSFAGVKAKVETKIAAMRPLQTFALFEQDEEGELIAIENLPKRGEDPRQQEIDDDDEKVTVHPSSRRREESN